MFPACHALPAPAPPPLGGRTGSDGSCPDAGSTQTAPTDPAVGPRAPNSPRRWANWRRKADSNSRSHEGSARRAWAERDTVGQRQEYPVPSGPSDLRPFSAAKNYVHRGNGTRAARPRPLDEPPPKDAVGRFRPFAGRAEPTESALPLCATLGVRFCSRRISDDPRDSR